MTTQTTTLSNLAEVAFALRRLLGGGSVSATIVGDASNSAASRVAYQSNLKALTGSNAQLVGRRTPQRQH